MQRYLEEFSARIKASEDVLSVEDTFLALSKDNDCLKAEMARLLDLYRTEPASISQGISSYQIQLSPLHDPHAVYDVALSRHRTTPSAIVTPSVYGLVCALNTDLHVDRYVLPADWDCAQFVAGAKLERRDEICVPKGAIFPIRPGRDVYRFRIDRYTMILKITSRWAVPFEWSFDEDTLEAWQSISTVPAETNLMHACRAAAALGDSTFVDPLSGLLRHDRHIVRWEALKALCALDKGAGLDGLALLAQDSHPHVSRAAQRAMRSVATQGQ